MNRLVEGQLRVLSFHNMSLSSNLA